MAANPGTQDGMATFQEEKAKKEAPVRRTVQPTKKQEPLGRGLIAWVSIGILGGAFAILIEGLGPATPAGAVCWVVAIGMIALIAKWAKWF